MSLYEMCVVLDLWYRVVPVVPKGGFMTDEYDWEPADLFSSNFHGFNGGQNDSGNLGGEDERGWGVGMPSDKCTWVNPSDPELREVQMAYIVVSVLSWCTSRSRMNSTHIKVVRQRSWKHQCQVFPRRNAGSHPSVQQARPAGRHVSELLGWYQKRRCWFEVSRLLGEERWL